VYACNAKQGSIRNPHPSAPGSFVVSLLQIDAAVDADSLRALSAFHRILAGQTLSQRLAAEWVRSHLLAVLVVPCAEVGDFASPVGSEEAFVANEAGQGVF
jgi:hypothetical protein